MFIERPLNYFKAFYKGATWRLNKDKKIIYLTFDDGPVPEVTPKVLDILDSYGIKATFFCVGQNVEKYPLVYKEVLDRGHAVGNHTHNHVKGFACNNADYFANVALAAHFIDSDLFRPPYGRIKPSQLRELKKKYTIVLWDLITRDYNRKLSPEYILINIKSLTRKGSIIVFHDSLKAEKNVLAVLPRAIEFWQKKGYQFGLL